MRLVKLMPKAVKQVVTRDFPSVCQTAEGLSNVEGRIAHKVRLVEVLLRDRVEDVGPGFAVELSGLRVEAICVCELTLKVLWFFCGQFSQDLL